MTVGRTHGGRPSLKASLRSSILSGKRPALRPQATMSSVLPVQAVRPHGNSPAIVWESAPTAQGEEVLQRGASPRKMPFILDPPRSSLRQVPSVYHPLYHEAPPWTLLPVLTPCPFPKMSEAMGLRSRKLSFSKYQSDIGGLENLCEMNS